MQFLLALLATLLLFSPLSGAPAPWRSNELAVRAVIDGDTIDVATIGRINLLGITAPRDSRERLAALVLHRFVRLETDGEPLGASGSGRAAYVFTGDGQFVNALLVREGLARVSTRSVFARVDELMSAEREAQAARRGVWGDAPRRSPGYTPRSTRSR